jgi:hypothetical protein
VLGFHVNAFSPPRPSLNRLGTPPRKRGGEIYAFVSQLHFDYEIIICARFPLLFKEGIFAATQVGAKRGGV